ncbi:hypothetical protein [Streptomyces cyaneofuscatus]|uniref:hypothetical protein n=1 Tax=Streptomyces cyaneofuscatus TaxID=66883 RepID=UPI00378C37D6
MPPLDLTADEVLTITRAVRRRLDLARPVERALIEGCLRLATQAPTGRSRQHWDFVLVTDPTSGPSQLLPPPPSRLQPVMPPKESRGSSGASRSTEGWGGAGVASVDMHGKASGEIIWWPTIL